MISRKLGTFLQPRLIIFRRIDDERAFHRVMSEAAELTANDFIRAGLNRFEPHGNDLARDRVLRDAHVRKTKIVNHIFGRKLDDDGPIHRDVQLAQHNEIVLSGGIVGVEP